jgi:hypothetical protein
MLVQPYLFFEARSPETHFRGAMCDAGGHAPSWQGFPGRDRARPSNRFTK